MAKEQQKFKGGNPKFEGEKDERSDYRDGAVHRGRGGKPGGSGRYGARGGHKASTNDPKDYANNPELLRIVTNLNTFTPVGSNAKVIQDPSVIDAGSVMPGIMTMYVAPSLGVATGSEVDAVNLATTNLWAEVKKAFTNNITNIEPVDFAMYTFAGGQAYLLYAYVRRALVRINSFNQMNYYMPKALIRAMGFDYEDMVDNYQNYLVLMSYYESALSRFAFPDVWPMARNYHKMCTNVFSDGDSAMSQIYVPVPTHIYKYHGFTNQTGTELQMRALFPVSDDVIVPRTGYLTFEMVKELFDEVLMAFLNDSDTSIMSSIAMKAFGDHLLDYDAVKGKVENRIISDDTWILTQFQNWEYLGLPYGDWNVTQNEFSQMVFQPKCAGTILDSFKHKHFYSSFDQSRTSDFLIDTLQGKCNYEVGEDIVNPYGTKVLKILSSSSVIPLAFTITKLTDDGDNIASALLTTNMDYDRVARGTFVNKMMFRYAPFQFVFSGSEDGIYTFLGVHGDIDNYFFLVDQDVERINLCSVLSLYNIEGSTKI